MPGTVGKHLPATVAAGLTEAGLSLEAVAARAAGTQNTANAQDALQGTQPREDTQDMAQADR